MVDRLINPGNILMEKLSTDILETTGAMRVIVVNSEIRVYSKDEI